MAHYRFTDIVGLTYRFDIFNDKDGVGFLVEFRYDKSNEDVFLNGARNLVDDFFSVAVEFAFAWQETFQALAKNRTLRWKKSRHVVVGGSRNKLENIISVALGENTM